jgi:uncharacterized protein (DUF302 family)
MKKLQVVFFSLLLAWSTVGSAGHWYYHDNNFSITDFDSVSEAVDEIKATLENQGLEIVGVLDHAANAKRVGLELPPTQLILFRDKRLERKLIRRSPTAAIDLPLKILVWEDADTGEIKLLYNAPGYLFDRHNISAWDPLHYRLNKRMKQFGQLENGLVTTDTEQSVDETVEKLKEVLLDNGFFIPFTFDFTRKSRFWHIKRPAQLIIFGNPKVGTPLMQNRQSIGIDLPQKFLVWEDRDGQVHVTYNDPLFMGKRHGLQGLNEMLGKIGNRLGALAKQGAK